MIKDSKIYVAGHTGLVGSAIVRKLVSEGYSNIIGKTSSELDLRNQYAVKSFFEREKPEYVFLAAAKVGGIFANNTYPANFIYDNLMIESNVIHTSYSNSVKKLLFLGSSCIYPKNCPQPIKEEYLLTGPLEPTNEAYALAKISGLKMCEYYRRQYGCDFISVMPTNLYGPGDNFDLETSHVLPAIIRKMHLAKCLENSDFANVRLDLNKRPFKDNIDQASDKEIILKLEKLGIKKEHKESYQLILWGTGLPKREFLHVNDLADSLLFLMMNYSEPNHINVGVGKDLMIQELSQIIKEVIGFNGMIKWNSIHPDGTMRKILNIEKLSKIGWEAKISLKKGIATLYRNYIRELYA